MSKLNDGAQAFRAERGTLDEDALPDTSTAVARGRLAKAAQRGDAAARQALKVYADERNREIFDDLNDQTRHVRE